MILSKVILFQLVVLWISAWSFQEENRIGDDEDQSDLDEVVLELREVVGNLQSIFQGVSASSPHAEAIRQILQKKKIIPYLCPEGGCPGGGGPEPPPCKPHPCNAQITTFTANPTKIDAGQQTTVQWSVNESGCREVILDGVIVAPSGSSTTGPLSSNRIFSIEVMNNCLDVVASEQVTVTVDTSKCTTLIHVTEMLIQNTVMGVIPATQTVSGFVMNRKAVVASIPLGTTFVSLHLEFECHSTNSLISWIPLSVTVDVLIALAVSHGMVTSSIISINSDIEPPWWVWFIAAGLGPEVIIAIGALDGVINSQMRPKLNEAVVKALKNAIPSLGFVLSINPGIHQVIVTVCL